ncbi:MAG: hypothetical protein U5R06_08410 [candidate division KSB1 bacterium]|nr:hypothetical protein [candidate division KSB1 bacterium]
MWAECFAMTRYRTVRQAADDDRRLCFNLSRSPLPSVHEGAYHLVSKLHPAHPGEYLYRLAHLAGRI